MDNFTEKVSGTLKYVTGYTQFSGTDAEQSGHYLALKVESSNGATLYVKGSDSQYSALESDGIIVIRVTDKDSQKIEIKASKSGQDTEFVYDLSGLTLE